MMALRVLVLLSAILCNSSALVLRPEADQELTPDQALQAVDEATALLEQPENAQVLKKVADEVKAASQDPQQRQMAMMFDLLPKVQKVLSPILSKYGFEGESALMDAFAQIQELATTSPKLQEKAQTLMGIVGYN
eukprot:TRINITY_DN23622_c0_g1_i1.p1 TRINITY_DN23622_c0_g1~~TRINITY_DN23622_c0_g1_i1.p1  ORF type:complete len:135 (+),score=39.23 TRINITY_DN23622_c0_g1_i1:77-481(+)